MRYKIVFSSGALNDVKEARKWYNAQQKGLGRRLINDIKATTELIKQNPFFASVKFENIRTASCKTFPYALHYEIDEQYHLVRITSIFHFSREPYWPKKDD